MKKITILFYALLMSILNAFAVDEFEKLVRPEALGYTHQADIVYHEKIDDQHIGVVISYYENNKEYLDYWLYNVYTKLANNVSIKDISIRNKRHLAPYYYSAYKYGYGLFLLDGDSVHVLMYEDEQGNDQHGLKIVSTNIRTQDQKIQNLSSFYSIASGLVYSGGRKFIIQSGSYDNGRFRLTEFSSNSNNVVWQIDDLGLEDMYNFDHTIPFNHRDKFYISGNNQLYTFNTSNFQIDTLILDTRDQDGLADYSYSVAMQYFPKGDDVYVVFNDLSVYTFYIITLASELNGYTRIWKTDGTRNGTKMVNRHLVSDIGRGEINFSKFFELDGRLLWFGNIDKNLELKFFEWNKNNLDSIGSINLDSTTAFMLFNNDNFYGNYLNYNNTRTLNFKNQDLLPIFKFHYDENYRIYSKLLLVGIESNQLKLYIKDEMIGYNDEYYSLHESWNIDEKLVIFRHKENQVDTFLYNVNAGFIFYDDYLNPQKDSIEFEYPSRYTTFSIYEFGNDLFFNYGESSNGDVIVWSFNQLNPTSVIKRIDKKSLDIHLYPNPSSNVISIQSSEFLQGQLLILGIDGRIYQTKKLNGHQEQMNIQNLASGTYIVIYEDSERYGVKTFIKQ